MKRYLIDIALFTLIALCALLIVELAIGNTHVAFNIKADYFKENKSTVKGLVLGSSQSHCAIDPDHFEYASMANLAQGGQTLPTNEKFFDQYIDDMDSLEFLILELSYHTLEYRLEMNDVTKHRNLRLYGINEFNRAVWPLDYSLVLSSPYEYLELLNPLSEQLNINRYGALNDIKSVAPVNLRFEKLNYDEEAIANQLNNRFITRHRKRNLDALPVNKEVVKRLINKAQALNLHVILIQPPLYKTYMAERIPDKLEKMETFLAELSAAHEDVLIIDCNEELQLDVRDYLNEDHTNYRGAEKVTELLSRRISERFGQK
jgi:hypothetical protein